ncbi:Probable multidrug resistance ABC transporter ATP-binding/permease protein YheI [Candidatus Ornithobacterium hominis]|uniref:Probable multidrug resistance ABC transporter ATP-binding/permease protein YheI n=1 Tax=Candidatus Ornithobacterium hominis TaxID=2497989 RepID=A0A383TXF3_9FLAO|nr:ABC transporter ATP-binding protein [Candidatus Ornithobacterium hominis]MCT7904175.1 ABC transporter ATP-binding protein/permease [Candidatus Ornithobacterium hominis]SZD72284.1 Probable multidrug resistance ABC transporter ATP-binding/permease protein YheI [Candidatus Ornithobacterium hominis]
MKELWTLNKHLAKYKWRLLVGVLIIIVLNFLSVYTVRFVGDAVNFIEEIIQARDKDSKHIQQLLKYGAIIIGLPIIAGFLQFLMRQTLIVTSRYIEFDLKNTIYQHYQFLDLNFYKSHRIGDLMNRISEDVGYVRQYLGPGIMYPINLVCLTIILIVEMLRVDQVMTIYTLISLPFLSGLVYLLSSHINKKSQIVQAEQSNISAFVQDIFSGIRVVKSYNQSNTVKRNYNIKAKTYKKKSIELANIEAFFTPLIIIVIGLSQILILYMGGIRYIRGEISEIGTLAQFFMYLNMLIWPFTSLGWVSMVIQRAEASMLRINEFLNTKPAVFNTNSKAFQLIGKIEFRDVSYTHKNTGILAINHLSFTLTPGKTLAILGKTGSGKTTLAQLIVRLFDPDEGQVLLDDQDVKDLNLASLRQQIGFVPQEAFLFSDTLAENLLFALDEKDLSKAKEYAKKADVHENIVNFSQGYETKVGERGVTLSGGQKQRISIARALIKQPKILIFDDSLSAVDTETEENILQNINSETEDKTTLIITHRVSSAKNADRIIYLENGRIKEEGTHQELLELNGEYQKLYQMQIENNTHYFKGLD